MNYTKFINFLRILRCAAHTHYVWKRIASYFPTVLPLNFGGQTHSREKRIRVETSLNPYCLERAKFDEEVLKRDKSTVRLD